MADILRNGKFISAQCADNNLVILRLGPWSVASTSYGSGSETNAAFNKRK